MFSVGGFIRPLRYHYAPMLDSYFWEKRPFFLTIPLFIMAYLTRLPAVGRYITPDELIWVFRSVRFSEALGSRAWAETLTTGHPGVPVTWLGALAVRLHLMFDPSLQTTYDWITHLAWLKPENMAAMRQLATFLTAGRLVLIGVNSLGVVIIFLLTWRLFSLRFGLITAVLLVFDPFLIGLSGLLHVDALLTTFSTISLLALALAVRQSEVRWRWFTAVSAIAAALALLTKSPAILLLPFSLFFITFNQLQKFNSTWRQRLKSIIASLLIWLVGYAATLFLLLPALWVSPIGVFLTVFTDSRRFVEDALRPTFFMGEATLSHPPTFYPISIAFRLSPLVFVGLLLAVGVAGLYVWRGDWLQPQQEQRAILHKLLCQPATIFLLWMVAFIVGITLAEKKFDRYALPVYPVLILLAVMGWRVVWRRLGRRISFSAAMLLLAVANYLPVAAYPLSGYNALLGGSRMAQRVLPIGWGDSVSAGTLWLERNVETANRAGIGGISQAFAPFYSGEPLLAGSAFYPQADYIVWTKLEEQMRLAQGEERPFHNATLLHTVRFGGLEQAWVYQQENPAGTLVAAEPLPERVSFDQRVRLLASDMAHSDDLFHVVLRWRLLDGGAEDVYTLRLSLKDGRDQTWYETEIPLLNDTDFYPTNWPNRETTVRYRIPLEQGLPPTSYTLEATLIDAATGMVLPIFNDDGAFIGTTTAVSQSTVPPTAANRDPFPTLPNVAAAQMGDSELTLLGFGDLPAQVATGAPLTLQLYWRADSQPEQDYGVRVWLDDRSFDFALNEFGTSQWQADTQLQGRYTLSVPTDFVDETAVIATQLLTENGELIPNTRYKLGTVSIERLDRLFTQPDFETPLDFTLGGQMRLLGVDGVETAVRPNETVTLRLYWQVVEPPPQLISAFVHLVQPDGSNLTQNDQWPGGLPSDLYAPEQYIIDQHTITIPADAPAGQYPLAVGLYTAADGVRLTAVDAKGTPVPDNRIFIPVQVVVGE